MSDHSRPSHRQVVGFLSGSPVEGDPHITLICLVIRCLSHLWRPTNNPTMRSADAFRGTSYYLYAVDQPGAA